MPFVDEFGYEIDYVADVVRRFKPDIGIVDSHFAHCFVDFFNHHFRVGVGGDSRFFRAGDDFVVHVRVVSRIGHVVTLFD